MKGIVIVVLFILVLVPLCNARVDVWKSTVPQAPGVVYPSQLHRCQAVGIKKINTVENLRMKFAKVPKTSQSSAISATSSAFPIGNPTGIAASILLRDGNNIPQVGLGVYKAESGNQGETENAVYNALNLGYRHIDTAEEYGNEADVGRAISRFLRESGLSRSEVWVTTKFYPSRGRGKAAVHSALKESLGKLQLDYVDLYLIHSPNEVSLRKEQWSALEELKDLGMTRSIGVSNYGIHHLHELITDSTTRYIPSVNQVELSPYNTRYELVQYCRKHGILPQAYSPLTKSVKLMDPKLRSIADKHGVTPAQVLLRWCIQKGYSVLPKSTRTHRLQENADVFCFNISAEDMAILDEFDEYLVTGWDPTRGP